tara:strand:- start:3845 stop:4408 length:564 start_codon:yes stop_codon:yes gene_type:complete
MVDYPMASSEDVLNHSVSRYTKINFPSYRFVPGIHPHPVNSPDGHSYGLEDEDVEKWNPDDWKYNEDYLYGIDLYNYHFYWEAHEAWEGLWLAAVRRSSEHMFIQGLIKTGAALLKVRMASFEIQDLIGARTLSKSGMDLLSRVGVSKFMGLDIVSYLESYSEFINPIFDNKIPDINQKTPRITLDF